MRKIAQLIVVVAALAALPAVADQREPMPGSERDPFSQTYTGRDHDEDRARAERERKEPASCDRSCPCGHAKGRPQATKA